MWYPFCISHTFAQRISYACDESITDDDSIAWTIFFAELTNGGFDLRNAFPPEMNGEKEVKQQNSSCWYTFRNENCVVEFMC